MDENFSHRSSRCKRMKSPAQRGNRSKSTADSATAETQAAVDLLVDQTALAAMMVADPTLEHRPAIWQQAGAVFRQGVTELASGDIFQSLIAAQMVAMNGALMCCMARAARAGDRTRAKKAELRLAELLLRHFMRHARTLAKSSPRRPRQRDRTVGPPISAAAALEAI